MTYDPFSFEAFQEREKQRRKKLVKALLIAAAVLVLLMTVYAVLFVQTPLSYDELGLSSRIEQTPDGVSIVVFTISGPTDRIFAKGGMTSDGFVDYEHEIDYRDWTFTFCASRWDKLFHPVEGTADVFQCFTTDGEQCERMEGKWHIGKGVVGVSGPNGEHLIFRLLVGRVFYKNSDGSTILLRDFTEDAP